MLHANIRRVRLGARFHKSARRPAMALLLAALAFVAYTSNGHIQGAGDTVAASLVATTLLTDFSFRLDRFAELWTAGGDRCPDVCNELAYFLTRTPRGVVSLYPVATGILAAPFMAPAISVSATPEAQAEAAHRQEKYAAAIITAVSIVAFAALCWQLGFSDWLTAGLTLFYALGSQAFNTSSQLLWQHGPGTLFILLAFLCFSRLQAHVTRAAAVSFALAWAVAVAIRPMNAVAVGPLVALAIYRFPRVDTYAVLPAILLGLPIVAYNLYFFGTIGGGYGTQVFSLGAGVPGLLLSPGRGLFLYFPIAVVALVLSVRRRLWLSDDIARAALMAVASAILFYGSYDQWHGGWSVGPRYLTEVEPLLLILLGLVWPARARGLGVACFGILLPYCIFIQAVGAYSTASLRWNDDRKPDGLGALWDFRDNPISHAFR